MNLHTLTQATYSNYRYQFILQFEESGNPNLAPYVDSAGLPSIGIGFNLTDDDIRWVVLRYMNIGPGTDLYDSLTAEGQAAEDDYVDQLTQIIKGEYFDASDNGLLTSLLNGVMADRAANELITGATSPVFELSSAEVQAIFTEVVDDPDNGKERTLTDWLTSDLDGPLIGDVEYSNERLALFSLTYNNPGKLLGPSLSEALKFNNRAEAWYEIRYNSNLYQEGGIAKRRYAEAALFGLYEQSPNDAEKRRHPSFHF